VISAEENKYKPPPIPKEVSNIDLWITYYNVISVGWKLRVNSY
jgi:hypothetical protein